MKSVKFLSSFGFPGIFFLGLVFPMMLCIPPPDTSNKTDMPSTVSGSETTESLSLTGDFNSSVTEMLEKETNGNQEKDSLVINLSSVGDELAKATTTGNQELIQSLLTDFKQLWFQIDNKSSYWHGDEPQGLRIYAAKILYIAKDRLCESPDETFFTGQCLLIGDTEHCPENMELNDGPKNEGFCDCLNIEGQALFYSEKTGNCHVHNTRGPCEEGQWFHWFSFKKAPQCEPVPEGCPADGQHVFWGPEATTNQTKQCWELGCQGPCSLDEILHLEQNTNDLNIYCRTPTPSIFAVSPISLSYSSPCRVGTLRNRLGQCSHGFFG